MLKFEDFLTNVSVEDVVAALKRKYKIPFIEKGTFRAQIPLIVKSADSEPCHILVPAVVNLKTDEATAIYDKTQVQIRNNQFYIENDRTESIFFYIASRLLELLDNPKECTRGSYSAFTNNLFVHPLDYINCFLEEMVPGIDYLFLTEIKDKVPGVPTFDATNGYMCEPVEAIPHPLEELQCLQYGMYTVPKGVSIPNSFPLYDIAISKQICEKMGLPVPYPDSRIESDALEACHERFKEICFNFFFDHLSDYAPLMRELYDSLAIDIFNGRGTPVKTHSMKRAADALGIPVPDFTSKEIMLPSGRVLKASDTTNVGFPGEMPLPPNENLEDFFSQLCQSSPLFEDVPSQDFHELNDMSQYSFKDTPSPDSTIYHSPSKEFQIFLIKQIAEEEGLTLNDKETEEVLALLPTAELDVEAFDRAVRTALQPQIEKARAFFTGE